MTPIAAIPLIFASMQRWQCLVFYLPPLLFAIVLLVITERDAAREREATKTKGEREAKP